MRDPDKKKTISNEVIFNVIGIVGVILLVPINVCILVSGYKCASTG